MALAEKGRRPPGTPGAALAGRKIRPELRIEARPFSRSRESTPPAHRLRAAWGWDFTVSLDKGCAVGPEWPEPSPRGAPAQDPGYRLDVSEPHAPFRGSATRLIDRERECRLLDQSLAAVRDGESRALILHGEAGMGKTALLEYLSERASDAGCQVVSAAGVQSEMELAFASLHQLCNAPFGSAECHPKAAT